MPDTNDNYAVEMVNISKKFGIVPVLKNVNLKVKHGEIHALLGENGAGKSTLIKILSGVHQKDGGQIHLNGKAINPKSPHDSKVLGISVVFQELSLVNGLSVAENIYLHKLGANKFWMNWKTITNDAKQLIDTLGFDIDPSALVMNLSIVQKQVVEIAKALAEDTKVLVLDEPTTVFDPKDKQKLFDNLHRLKNEGMAIIYISHHLDEVFEISDSITVLRDGVDTGHKSVSELDTDQVIKLMIGRELEDMYPKRIAKIGSEPIFEVKHLTAKNSMVNNVSFSVRPGEVVGIAGLGGSGRTETAKLMFGADALKSGKMYLEGKALKIGTPSEAIKYIGFVSEDRKEEGVFLKLSVKKNISITNFKGISNKMGFINSNTEFANANSLIDKLSIKVSSPDDAVENLSGGNQQKVALAKWLGTHCKAVIIDEPTRGVDVGAKAEIYKVINQVAQRGVALIIISSDMLEIMGIADRILVMKEGSIYGELPKEKFSEENILRYCIGEPLKHEDKASIAPPLT